VLTTLVAVALAACGAAPPPASSPPQTPAHAPVSPPARKRAARPAPGLPAVRPPVLTGTVKASNGAPAAGAMVGFKVAYRSGATMSTTSMPVLDDGSFVIPHPHANDLDSELDVVTIEAWAERGNEVASVQPAAPGGTLALQLAAPAQLDGTITGAKGAAVKVEIEVEGPGSTRRSRSITVQKQLDARDTFDAGVLPSGPVEVIVRAKDGRVARAQTVLQGGGPNHVSLTLARAGTLALQVVDDRGPIDVYPVIDGDLIEDRQRRRAGGPIEVRGLAAGPHLVELMHDDWTMTRTHTVAAGGDARLTVRFEADIAPGRIGTALQQDPAGVSVLYVVPGSPADTAGIVKGDVIAAIDGTRPTDVASAVKLLVGAAGTNVDITLGSGRAIRVTRSSGTGQYAPGGPPELVATAPPPTISISRQIPFQQWPDLGDRVIGIVYAGGKEPWGGSIDHLRGVDANPQNHEYVLAANGSSPYPLLWAASSGGSNFLPGVTVCIPGGATDKVDAALYKPGDKNAYKLSRRAHIVELVINGGKGSCGEQFVVTGARILDRTHAIPMDPEKTLLELRRRFDKLVAKHKTDLRATIEKLPLGVKNEKTTKDLGVLPSWLGPEEQLEVLFVYRELREGLKLSATWRPAPFLFARPRMPDPVRVAKGAAIGARYTVDKTGKFIGEKIYLPSSFTESDQTSPTDWYRY
jgi:hypothetical protein